MRQVITRQPVMVGNTKIGDKELVVNQPVPEVNNNNIFYWPISYIAGVQVLSTTITQTQRDNLTTTAKSSFYNDLCFSHKNPLHRNRPRRRLRP